MQFFKQAAVVTALSLGTLRQRLGASSVIVIGIAGVVAVLVSLLGMVTGLTQSMSAGGHADRAIVMSTGTTYEIMSNLSREATAMIADSAGVKHEADNRPLTSAEALVVVRLPLRTNGNGNLTLRGVSQVAFALRPELRVVEGRMFNPGLRELIVGRTAERQFRDLAVGRHLTLRGTEWTVVGIFESPGDPHAAELLTGVEVLQSAFQRNTFQSVAVQLQSAQSFGNFRSSVAANRALAVDVARESDYYLAQTRSFTELLSLIAHTVGSIMAIGAVFGALNTMYAAVSTRTVEIATLRVLGFGSGSIVISVLAEALLLAAAGGVIGGCLAWLFFSGHTVSTNGGGLTQLAVPLVVNARLIVLGIAWACAIGLVGASLPAIRAARAPLISALNGL
jgi:putative ABC transport system permease protein